MNDKMKLFYWDEIEALESCEGFWDGSIVVLSGSLEEAMKIVEGECLYLYGEEDDRPEKIMNEIRTKTPEIYEGNKAIIFPGC